MSLDLECPFCPAFVAATSASVARPAIGARKTLNFVSDHYFLETNLAIIFFIFIFKSLIRNETFVKGDFSY